MPLTPRPTRYGARSRIRKRQVLAYVICAIVFSITVATALRLSHPGDGYPRIRQGASDSGPEVSVQTQNEMLSVKVGDDTYRYRLIQTDRGLAAEEVRKAAR